MECAHAAPYRLRQQIGCRLFDQRSQRWCELKNLEDSDSP